MGNERRSPPSRLASSAVHQQLREQILSGQLAPGEPVPSERQLSDEMGVNRHAVREALKRLQQAGLVRIAQGGATRVRDWRSSAGLEVMLDLVEHGADPPAELMRSVLEMRACIGVDAARRCAERATLPERRRVESLAADVADGVEAGDAPGMEPFISLWQLVVDGAGNLAYRLALNSLNSALTAYPQLGELLAPRDPDSLRALGTSIAAGDGDAASRAARRLLESDIDLAA